MSISPSACSRRHRSPMLLLALLAAAGAGCELGPNPSKPDAEPTADMGHHADAAPDDAGSGDAGQVDFGGPDPIGETITRNIGPEGGRLALYGAMVVIPPGALPEVIAITISETPRAAPAAAFPDGVSPAGPRFTLQPHGIAFQQPVTITIDHDGTAEVPAVHRLDDEQDPTWEPVAGATFTEAGATFTAMTFSVVVVTEASAGQPGVRSITITRDDTPAGDQSLAPGESLDLGFRLVVDEGVSQRVLWTSSDPAVATVDGFGHVTAVRRGSASIRVAARANEARFDEIQLTVTDPCAPRDLAVGETGRGIFSADNCGRIAALGGAFADSPWAAGIDYAMAYRFTVPARGYYTVIASGAPQKVGFALEGGGALLAWGALLDVVSSQLLLEPGVEYRVAVGVDFNGVRGFPTEGPLTFTVAPIPLVGTRLDVSADFTEFCASAIHGSYQVKPGRSTLFGDLIGANSGCNAPNFSPSDDYSAWHTYQVVQAEAPDGSVTTWRVCSGETQIQVYGADGELVGDDNGATAPSTVGWTYEAEPYTPYYLVVYSDARFLAREPDNIRVTTGPDCGGF